MANEFTLADYERTAKDPLEKAVVRTWRENSDIMEFLKFKTSVNLTEKILRLGSLPDVPWRKVGETFADLKVNPDGIEERLFFMGAKIDIPYEYEKASSASMVNNRELQEEAIMVGAARAFQTAFFINTPLEDEDAITGLWYRMKNDLGSGQYFDANLDVSKDTAVTNVEKRFFDEVAQLLQLVDGNDDQKVLFMGNTMYLRFQAACRNSGLLDTTQDNLKRNFLTYGKGGPKIVDVGYQYDGTTAILGDIEDGLTDRDGGSDSSMYCVRFGEPYMSGWCQEKPTAKDVGLTEDQVNYRTVVRFSPGIYMVNPRCAAWAYGFTAA